MGTNYYLMRHVERCTCCGQPNAEVSPIHIGKSSCGWCFSLHIHPDKEIMGLDDYIPLFLEYGAEIFDEYDKEISLRDMLEIIAKRNYPDDKTVPPGYSNWEDFYAQNQATAGPDNLCRHKVDNKHCVGHGSGTWDLMIGDDSSW